MNGAGDLLGALAPPMINGEVLFEAPWQGRVFGMARRLSDAGLYSWDEFRACLIRRVGDWDRGGEESDYAYYDHFLRALEDVLQAKGVFEAAMLERRYEALAARPHDHDHRHDHDHDHDHDHEHHRDHDDH